MKKTPLALWLYLGLLLPVCWLQGCESFWGSETDTDFLDVPIYNDQTVAYVPIQPVWEGFSRPVDVVAGWDELIYVADAGTEEVVSFDQAGNELGRFPVPGLTAIAQDRRLDLLALGTRDTVISNTAFRLPALYRLRLRGADGYGLQYARVVRVVIHPFYFKSGTPTQSDEAVSLRSISVLADNRYYVSRNGPSNNPLKFGGPDDAVLLFNAQDEFVTPVQVSTALGLFRDYFRSPQGITTFAAPPQSPAVNRRGDFIFTSTEPNNVLKVQIIRLEESAGGSSYRLLQTLVGDTSKADDFLYRPGRFGRPTDVCVAGDGTNYIFVVDVEKDSLFQFNALGYEGVNPPAGSSSRKAIRASFGGRGQGLTQFNEPRAVAYLRQIVYVADAGNARLLRFKLTTDFD
ncbi:MAG: hypothetical protein D6730_07700 [Bacteroidetes bacterium]|nr:MAG: hypothetical protein D6730_07700 [Bacteroidota bacterium]